MENFVFRLLKSADAGNMCAYYQRNREHFRPWEPGRGDFFFTLGAWQEMINARLQEQVQQRGFYFVAEQQDSGNIYAHCSLSNICYGPFMAAFMGYGVDREFEGRGLTRALCEEVIRFAFTDLRLNRISANYMPHNQRSGGLLKRLGFTIEGRASAYLKINNRWEDHVLTSLLNPDRGI